MNKNVIMGVIAAAALGVALYLMLSGNQSATSDDPAESLDQQQVWVCKQCQTDVRMTKAQYIDALRGGTFVCPNCGSGELQNAVTCPFCGQGIPTIGHGRVPSVCPRCNKQLGEWRDLGSDPAQGLPNTEAPAQPGR